MCHNQTSLTDCHCILHSTWPFKTRVFRIWLLKPQTWGISAYCCCSASCCLISPRARMPILRGGTGPRLHVCLVCCRRWANEEEVSASLRERVVSEDPISHEPRATPQGPRRSASTDEFVSVIKPRGGCARHNQTNAAARKLFIQEAAAAAARPFTALVQLARMC